MGHIINFLGLKIDIFKIKAQLPKDKLDKVIEKIENIFEKKTFTTYKELQSFVNFLFFANKIILLSQTFF